MPPGNPFADLLFFMQSLYRYTTVKPLIVMSL